MKNDYVRGAPNPNSGGYGSGGYGYGTGGYGGYGGYGSGYGGGAGPQRSFKDYFLIFRERIWYLLVAFFIIFSGTILYTFNKTKIYTAVSQVQLFRDDASALGAYGEGAEMELNQILGAEDFNTQIIVFESLNIMQGVEQRLQDELRERFMAPYMDTLSFSCLLYTSPSPRDDATSRMPSSA